MKNQKGFVWAPALIMIGVILVSGTAAYLLIQASNTNQTENSNANIVVMNQTDGNTNAVNNSNTASWQTYSDTNNKYSIQYPSNYTRLGEGELVQFISNNVSSENLEGVNILIHIRDDSDASRWARGGFTAPLPTGYSNVRTVKIGENVFTAADEEGNNLKTVHYFISNGMTLFEISDSSTNKEESEATSIISTFAFTK